MAADTTGVGEKGRTAADDFPEFPQMPTAIKQAAVEFYGKWQEFTSKRGSTVRSARPHIEARECGHGTNIMHLILRTFWRVIS